MHGNLRLNFRSCFFIKSQLGKKTSVHLDAVSVVLSWYICLNKRKYWQTLLRFYKHKMMGNRKKLHFKGLAHEEIFALYELGIKILKPGCSRSVELKICSGLLTHNSDFLKEKTLNFSQPTADVNSARFLVSVIGMADTQLPSLEQTAVVMQSKL
jgi:hypothetical protein